MSKCLGYLSILPLLFAFLLLAGCSPSHNQSITQQTPRNPNLQIDPRLTGYTDDFAFRLYAALAAAGSSQNIFISPTSIELALAMTYNGAEGATQQAMAAALGLPAGMTLDQVNSANAQLLALLQNPDSAVTLSIADALWGQQGVIFNANFLQNNTSYYGANISYLDFTTLPAASSSANTINQWVNNKTQGMIPTLVSAGDVEGALLVLTNALYFKGEWTAPFDPKQTQNGPFTLLDGSTQTLPLMQQTNTFDYLETPSFQAISLPYGNKYLNMYVFLPKAGVAWNDFLASMSAANWSTWMGQFSPGQVVLTMPRFTTSYSASLNNALTALGMGTAFTPQANFSGMLPAGNTSYHPLISDVIHKTALQIDEVGTVAAAATGVVVTTAVAPVQQTFMTVNHPFILAIQDKPTGAMLFLGSVCTP